MDSGFDLYRDAHGVGHAFADSVAGAFFAQGWIHTQDRLWQMERDRRRAKGRWAEVAGSLALALDLLVRRLDFEAAVRRDLAVLAPYTVEMLEAYAAGVNRSVASMDGALPDEFDQHGFTPEPWTAIDSLLIHRVRHVLMGSARYKLWRTVVRELGGAAALAVVDNEFDDDLAVIEGGSNNWVLAGAHTASGLPLLAGDPHRDLEVPNVYTQAHIACPEFDAIGMGFPGVPGFGHFGHNRRVAWSITHAMLDDQDLFVERFDDGGRYQLDDAAIEPVRRKEVVEVAGGDPVDVEIVVTGHGPVITGDTVDGEGLALRWTATCAPNRGFDCFVPMLTSESVTALFDALRAWVEPGNNLLAADIDGAAGYQFRGRVPIRPPANRDLPVPGWTAGHDWCGWVPFDELPRWVNPAGGRIVTANNRVSDQTAVYIGRDFAAPNRARRITERLDALGCATVDGMVGILGDVQSGPGVRIAASIKTQPRPSGPAGTVYDAITAWDGELSVESKGALAYEVFRREAMFVLMTGLGLDGAPDHPYVSLLPGIEPVATLWKLVPNAVDGDGAGPLISAALERAAAWLADNVGGEETWRWGAVHRTTLGVEVPGDADTVRVGSYIATAGFTCRVGSVARYVYDLADWDASRWVLPLGVSGRRDSPHLADQQAAWASGTLVPMPYTRSAIEASAPLPPDRIM